MGDWRGRLLLPAKREGEYARGKKEKVLTVASSKRSTKDCEICITNHPTGKIIREPVGAVGGKRKKKHH